MEGSSSISKVTGLQTGGSLQYSDKDQRPNGEISVNSKEELNHNISGVEKKLEVMTKQEIVKPAPAENFWTTKSDGAVKLRMGSSGRKSIVPRTVVQLFEQAVRVAPNRVALAVKRGGEWVKWTYQEYYESTRCAAKSFIKVCSSFKLHLRCLYLYFLCD